MSSHWGPLPRSARLGRIFCITCRKDFALGSSAPFAEGFSTVYGWHEGDISQSCASRDKKTSGVSVEISSYLTRALLDMYRSCTVYQPFLQFLDHSSVHILDMQSGPNRKPLWQSHRRYSEKEHDANPLRTVEKSFPEVDQDMHLSHCRILWLGLTYRIKCGSGRSWVLMRQETKIIK